MEVKNISWGAAVDSRNHPLLPTSMRGLIIGKTGCGKTTLLIHLLLNPGWLDYNRLFVFGKSLFQSEYTILKKAMQEKIPNEIIIKIFEQVNTLQMKVYPTLNYETKYLKLTLNVTFMNRLRTYLILGT